MRDTSYGILPKASRCWAALEHLLPQVVLLDLELPDISGMAILRHISEIIICPVPWWLWTAHGLVDIAVDAMRRGAFDFFNQAV